MNYRLETLAYRDPGQTFAQQIASCPAYMAVREAVQNGIEAASDPAFLEQYGAGAARIEFTSTPGSEVEDGYAGRKFGVLSYGRAMTWRELVEYTDIGAGAKPRGLQGNFGIGMKLAGLAASSSGVVIRTYHPNYREPGLDPTDCVAEVMLAGQPDETGETVFGRLQLMPESIDNPCLRIRNQREFEGRDWSVPWTEIVFLGADPTDDTVAKLFSAVAGLYGNQYWSMAAVNCRYYTLPGGITIHRANVSQTNSAQAERIAAGLRQTVVEKWSLPEDGGNSSTVAMQHPAYGRCQVTYGLTAAGKDNGKSCASTLQAYGVPIENGGAGHAVLVWRGEIYDHRFGKRWGTIASKLGLPHGQKRLYVHIELIDDLVQPTQDRTRLRSRRRVGMADAEVGLEDFSEIVSHPDHIPSWVKAYMEDVSAGAWRSQTLQQELRQLIQQLQAQDKTRQRNKPDEEGEEVEIAAVPGEGLDEPREGRKRNSEPPTEKRKGRAVPTPALNEPDVRWVKIADSEGHFADDRQGAHFDPDANILRLNQEYTGFRAHLGTLCTEEGAEDETTRERIELALRDEYGLRVATHIISAYHNRNARVIEQKMLDAIFDPANFICLMTTFDRIVLMGFRERYRRLMKQVQHG